MTDWDQMVEAMSHRCAFDYEGDWAMCGGPLEAHHCIPKATLKSTYGWWDHLRKTDEWREGMPETLPDMDAVLADRRNLLPLCRRHHELVTGRRLYVTRLMLPVGIDAFAAELGLGWYMERFYDREGEVA